ncbi:S-layer homology domain-containing protein [Clostridiisalibacter paucivorans]|uniref:S-layer homology domain-containing protein n=1 Tax=Clostridiisalibacter paucivorans TaxID=408753 RepID=UPI000478C23A|nr:S-layer homology domain-containing protein [Clostridiisalibacter paucivorans]
MLSVFIIAMILIMPITNITVASQKQRVNPSRKELEKRIEEIARKRGIPSVLLKAIARVESVYKHFNTDGTVFTGSRGSIGLMQIHNRGAGFDTNKLKYDIDYNIDAGAEMLLRKWNVAVDKLPDVGNMDPNVLENWYFALWAYNGWAKSNNPNMRLKKYTYPELIQKILKEEYNQDITLIPPKWLPKSGLPDKSTKYNTPNPIHKGDIEFYKPGDTVKVDVNTTLMVRNNPGGASIGKFSNGAILDVLEGPKLNKGYYYYKVKKSSGNMTGWVAGNWIEKAEDVVSKPPEVSNENLPFEDIADSWSKEYIVYLNNHDIVKPREQNFNPDMYISREELCDILARALKLEAENYALIYDDVDEISPWALESVKALDKSGYIYGFVDNKFRPEHYVTREEMAVILTRIMGKRDVQYELPLKDAVLIEESAMDSVKNVYDRGLMKGDSDGLFNPKEKLTKAETCKIVYELLNKKS